MCPSNYNHFWDRAPFGTEKLEWCRYRWWKNFEDTFIRFDVIHERDGQTDGRTLHDSKDRAYASHRAVKTENLCCHPLNTMSGSEKSRFGM